MPRFALTEGGLRCSNSCNHHYTPVASQSPPRSKGRQSGLRPWPALEHDHRAVGVASAKFVRQRYELARSQLEAAVRSSFQKTTGQTLLSSSTSLWNVETSIRVTAHRPGGSREYALTWKATPGQIPTKGDGKPPRTGAATPQSPGAPSACSRGITKESLCKHRTPALAICALALLLRSRGTSRQSGGGSFAAMPCFCGYKRRVSGGALR